MHFILNIFKIAEFESDWEYNASGTDDEVI